jgi:hypothetical protein
VAKVIGQQFAGPEFPTPCPYSWIVINQKILTTIQLNDIFIGKGVMEL